MNWRVRLKWRWVFFLYWWRQESDWDFIPWWLYDGFDGIGLRVALGLWDWLATKIQRRRIVGADAEP